MNKRMSNEPCYWERKWFRDLRTAISFSF